jgi:hypothetical protein
LRSRFSTTGLVAWSSAVQRFPEPFEKGFFAYAILRCRRNSICLNFSQSCFVCSRCRCKSGHTGSCDESLSTPQRPYPIGALRVPGIHPELYRPAGAEFHDRLKERGMHQTVAEVTYTRRLLAIVYGCWSNTDGSTRRTRNARRRGRHRRNLPPTLPMRKVRTRASTCRPRSHERGQRKKMSLRQRRALVLQRVAKGPSSTKIITANLLLSKSDIQLGIFIHNWVHESDLTVGKRLKSHSTSMIECQYGSFRES